MALRVETPRAAMPRLPMNFSRDAENFMMFIVVVGAVEKSTSQRIPRGKRELEVRKLLIVPSRAVGLRFVESAAQGLDRIEGVPVAPHLLGYALVGVQDGGVVAAAEAPSDRRQGLVGELAREVHG